jgi:aspartokinase
MRTVSSIVSSIFSEDDMATQALSNGVLNLSAYAAKILPLVEEKAWKSVQKGTIVVALARIAQNQELPNLRPQVTIDDLKIKSPLCDITYEKTEENTQSVQTLRTALPIQPRSVFAMTEGMSEITIVASQDLLPAIQDHFGVKPKSLFPNVTGISVGFSKEYLAIPNAIYTIMNSVAVKHINIIEIISTYTELMFVLEDRDREVCVQALERHFRKTS